MTESFEELWRDARELDRSVPFLLLVRLAPN